MERGNAQDLFGRINRLPVKRSAKRIIQSFVEAECLPNICMSPAKAEKLKGLILRSVEFAVECVGISPISANPCKIRSCDLAAELMVLVNFHRLSKRVCVSAKLADLARLVRPSRLHSPK